MLVIEEEQIIIKSSHSGVAACRVIALGGPDDPVIINGIELTSDELESLQTAILNFMNTGYFNQEI